jgi:hypothetical protein
MNSASSPKPVSPTERAGCLSDAKRCTEGPGSGGLQLVPDSGHQVGDLVTS